MWRNVFEQTQTHRHLCRGVLTAINKYQLVETILFCSCLEIYTKITIQFSLYIRGKFKHVHTKTHVFTPYTFTHGTQTHCVFSFNHIFFLFFFRERSLSGRCTANLQSCTCYLSTGKKMFKVV